MVFEALPTNRHDVRVLAAGFQFSGQLETVGALLNYINDSDRNSLSLYDVRLSPLTPGSPLQGFSRPHIVVRRQQIIFLYFIEEESRASIRTLRRRELLVAYTPVAVCRGYFHMADETNLNDFLDVTQDELLPITEARVFPLIEFPAPFPTEAELLLVGRSQLRSYHPA